MREGGVSASPTAPEVEGGKLEASDAREVEWQFDAFDLRPVERWIAPRVQTESAASTPSSGSAASLDSNGAVLRSQPPRELVDTYLETDDWRFHRAGYSLRLRQQDRHVEATLKSLVTSSDGLRNRREINEQLPAAEIDALLKSDGPVGHRVRAVAGSHVVKPIVKIRTRRRPFTVTLGEVSAGEIIIDETVVAMPDDGEPARLQRVEVEAAGESIDPLASLVDELREQCQLQPSKLSKFETALLTAGLEPPLAPDLGPTSIDATSSIGDVAFANLRRHFGEFLEKEPGTRLAEDAEDLHDMRVASRRLRAALSLFVEVLPVRASRLRAELGWVADALGAARDLDVQREQLEVWIAKADEDDREPLEALREVLQAERARAQILLLRTLDAKRYERLVTNFTGFGRRGPARSSRNARVPAVAIAPHLITARYDKVAKARKGVKRDPSPERYHKLRIRCKRLRYAMEFFADVYGDPARTPIRRMSKLQDILGKMQDAAVAVARLRALATGGRGLSPATIFAMGHVASRYQRKATRQERRFPKAFRKFRGNSWRSFVHVMERERSLAARTAWGAQPPALVPTVETPVPSASAEGT